MEAALAEADRQLAELIQLQQIQQKQELMRLSEAHAVSNADVEFRRGLEELIQDHLNTCMAVANCGPTAPHHHAYLTHPATVGPSSSGVSAPGATDSAETDVGSSASGVISSGSTSDGAGASFYTVAGCTGAMAMDAASLPSLAADASDSDEEYGCISDLATIDDAGGSVMASSSGQVQSPVGPTPGDISAAAAAVPTAADGAAVNGGGTDAMDETASPAQASVAHALHRWDGMHADAEAVRISLERDARESELLRLAGLHAVSMLDDSVLASPSLSSHPPSIDAASFAAPGHLDASVMHMWRQIEADTAGVVQPPPLERPLSGGDSTDGLTGSSEEVHEGEGTPGAGQSDGVFQMEGGGGMEVTVTTDRGRGRSPGYLSASTSSSNLSSSQPSPHTTAPVSATVAMQTSNNTGANSTTQQQQVLDGRVEEEAHLMRLLVRVERERQQELAALLSFRAVTESSSRSRLQAWMQRRYILADSDFPAAAGGGAARLGTQQQRVDGGEVEEQTQMTEARQELGLLRTHRFVSGLEAQFRSHLETLVALGPTRAWERGFQQQQQRQRQWQEESQLRGAQQQEQQEQQSGTAVRGNDGHPQGQFAGALPPPPRGAPAATVPSGATNARTLPPHRPTQPSPAPLPLPPQHTILAGSRAVGRGPRRLPPAPPPPPPFGTSPLSVYNEELQELLSRRSVTRVLTSEFRHRLEHLLHSFVTLRGPMAAAGVVASPFALPPPLQRRQQLRQEQQRQQLEQQRQQQAGQVDDPDQVNGGEDVQGQEPRAATVARRPPPPPPPPRGPHWQMPFHHAQHYGFNQHTAQRHMDHGWMEVRDEVRAMEARMQEQVQRVEQAMEVCLSMMSELQRAQRQELAGALQRVYNSGRGVPQEALDGHRWALIRSGTCCVCCDKPINCLLYRCGHMCTCVDCANELKKRDQNCPMCRAPIVEAVRAYTATGGDN